MIAETWTSLVKAHERLILVLALLGACLFLANKGIDKWDDHERARAQAQTVTAVEGKTLQAATDAQLAQNSKSLELLQNEISVLNSEIAAKVKIDATLSAPETAQRLGGQAVGTDVDLPLDTAHRILANLDTLAPVQSELNDTTKALDQSQATIASQQTLISNLNDQISSSTKVCDARVAATKADALKSKGIWFKVGLALGAIAGGFVGHAL